MILLANAILVQPGVAQNLGEAGARSTSRLAMVYPGAKPKATVNSILDHWKHKILNSIATPPKQPPQPPQLIVFCAKAPRQNEFAWADVTWSPLVREPTFTINWDWKNDFPIMMAASTRVKKSAEVGHAGINNHPYTSVGKYEVFVTAAGDMNGKNVTANGSCDIQVTAAPTAIVIPVPGPGGRGGFRGPRGGLLPKGGDGPAQNRQNPPSGINDDKPPSQDSSGTSQQSGDTTISTTDHNGRTFRNVVLTLTADRKKAVVGRQVKFTLTAQPAIQFGQLRYFFDDDPPEDGGNEKRHSFRTVGEHTVSVAMLAESGGETERATTSVIIEDPRPPVLTLTPERSVTAGEYTTIRAKLSPVDNEARFLFYWGDGSDVEEVDLQGAGQHLYTKSGTYTVRVVAETGQETPVTTASKNMILEVASEPPDPHFIVLVTAMLLITVGGHVWQRNLTAKMHAVPRPGVHIVPGIAIVDEDSHVSVTFRAGAKPGGDSIRML